MGRQPAQNIDLYSGWNRNLLLQPADFRQQRQQQTNLLQHTSGFAVSPGPKMLIRVCNYCACCTRCSSAGVWCSASST